MTTERIRRVCLMQLSRPWSEKQMVADSVLIGQRLTPLVLFVLHFTSSWACREGKKTLIATFLNTWHSLRLQLLQKALSCEGVWGIHLATCVNQQPDIWQ